MIRHSGSHDHALAPRIRPYGEAAWMVDIGGGIDVDANALALAIAGAVRTEAGPGWPAPIAAYDSVLVPFDPELLGAAEAQARLTAIVTAVAQRPPTPVTGRLHHIPVRYGGDGGPDLESVADALGSSPARVVELHTAATYRVFMLGFAPGFAYLGPLAEALRLPRRDQPRPRVPAGSVAIAGSQTAIYPHSTPGGWHLIGRTDTRIWDAGRPEPALFAAGDTVRFEPLPD